ncbi:MAG TPA: hypothetical protein VHQ24_12625 [Lachnospiraceae bacterium]|nr:hypothetical protein [Lachnospiraceae bacterium]HEX3077700.1 hypothetical protein [Lachnospiraceae bacterium]
MLFFLRKKIRIEENRKDEKVSSTVEVTDTDLNQEKEFEILEREILPEKIICPDCGGITLEGLDYCDKCGGEL